MLITGGSSGIGLQIARTLASAGAKVYSASPHVEGAKAALTQLRSALQKHCLTSLGPDDR